MIKWAVIPNYFRSINVRQAKTACFLDFDHTLFNTDEFFHVDLRGCIRQLGIDMICWEASYSAIWDSGYTLEKHIEEINRRSRNQISLDEIEQYLCLDLSKYLYPDVFPSLEIMKSDGVTLFLLSFGNPDWQRYKVFGSRVSDYVDYMFFTAREGTKADLIAQNIGEYEKLFVVDNNPGELDLIKDVKPDIKTYCINRVPDKFLIPIDEMSKFRFLEARKYRDREQRHPHVTCRSLHDILTYENN